MHNLRQGLASRFMWDGSVAGVWGKRHSRRARLGRRGAPLLVKVAATARHDRLDEAQLAPISPDCKREAHRVEDGEHLARGRKVARCKGGV